MAMTLTEIQDATKADPTICKVIQLIKEGLWGSLSENQGFADGIDVAALMSFKKIKDEQTVTATDDTAMGHKECCPPFFTNQGNITCTIRPSGGG